MSKRILIKILTVVLVCLTSAKYTANAQIMTDAAIQKLAANLNKANHDTNIDYSVQKRYVVVNTKGCSEKNVNSISKETIVASFSDDIATMFSTNFIGIKAVFHYTMKTGAATSKTVTVSPFDFLELGQKKRIKKTPPGSEVNIEYVQPRGWHEVTTRNPHTIINFMVGEGDNQLAFVIQQQDSPTFMSRGEFSRILEGEIILGTTKQIFLDDIKGNILDISETTVGLYPALRVKVDHTLHIEGQRKSAYTNDWIIMYEDHTVYIYGTALEVSDFEKPLYDTLYEKIVGAIRFPDQFE